MTPWPAKNGRLKSLVDVTRCAERLEVVIRGPHGQLSHCAQLVLKAAVGDFHALSVVELFQQVRVLAGNEITKTL